MAELPLPVRQEMPDIVISGYSQSADRSQRMAVVNNRLVQEGDELAAGLKVETIASDGIVFSYKNYRFRRQAF